ncbi:MAG: T9SS type A sorting domain-containing protein [Candidatus Cloacimonetes bacterium]|nr:T9SS type A sorting domain-containing protein [Candidatus Cloacimonadota bacterium]
MRFIKDKVNFLLPLLLLSSVVLTGVSGRVELNKEYPSAVDGLATQRRIHPAEQYFHSQRTARIASRTANFDKLLVLLIDFQEDDDPRTTGNGKFLLEFDPEYPITIGAPPHDYEYFSAILEAMRYYYLAASLGNYDLQYDIYPLEDDPKFAYTLPQQIGYYNPGLDNYDLFVARIEEYFFDIFTTADSYGEIDFGQYGHYLIIHAGSDWQHDIYGDSPSDLPSFFIQVGDGKEVWVNDGTVMIDHACNVPETISQDGRYGVINAVIAHEFGHSLGFVDLYNVNNFYPAVGYWDIMDAGGMGRLVDIGYDGEFYAIEGGLPTLPGAWHRLLIWGDVFEDMEVYKQITDFSVGEEITISAASNLYDQDNPLPYFVKVPLNAQEYLLLENRHVDPDGDGGIYFRGAAPITPGGTDYRVLLHPIGINDPTMKPIYEYDWLLPGWMSKSGKSYGGGIIAWHIDEKVIYEEGYTYADGTFASNYQINRINTNPNRRGIRIIEADNLHDIGNPYSWYWYGTEYEPFFRYKPLLDVDGDFAGWSYEEFSYNLSSTSKPALLTNNGYPSVYRIYDISSSAGIMTFKYSFEPFEETNILSKDVKINYLAYPSITSFLGGVSEMLVFTEEGVYFYRHLYDKWAGFLNNFDYLPTHPVTFYERTGYATIYYVTSGNKLIKISDNVSNFTQVVMELESDIIETPLLIEKDDDLLIVIPTEDELIIMSELGIELEEQISLAMPNARVVYDGYTLTAISDNVMYYITLPLLLTEAPDHLLFEHIQMPTSLGSNYYPVAYAPDQMIFYQDDTGDVYRSRLLSGQLENFFNLTQYTTAEPTQLALGNIGERVVYLFFAAGEYLFAVDIDGTMAQGYPKYIENRHFQPGGDVRILEIEGQTMLVLPVTSSSSEAATPKHFPRLIDEGYLFYDFENGLLAENSIIWNRPDYPDYFYWEEHSERLYFFFADTNENLYEAILTQTEEDPIVWNGYRNSKWSVYEGIHSPHTTPVETVKAYAFPNPSRKGEVRIRVEGGEERIELQIFDISGKRLFNNIYVENIGSIYDIRWNTTNIASGVYFGIVKTKGKSVNFKVAIE